MGAVCPSSFGGNSERFTREAPVLAQLNQTNIASIYGAEDQTLGSRQRY
jgi:hypothetical protein